MNFITATFEQTPSETIIEHEEFGENNRENGETDEELAINTYPEDNGKHSFILTCNIDDSEVVLLKDPHRNVTPSIIAHVCISFN